MYDAWSEYYHNDVWLKTFEECCVDPDFYTIRQREETEIFPWDFIDCGVTRQFSERMAQGTAGGCNSQLQNGMPGLRRCRYQTGVCLERKGQ